MSRLRFVVAALVLVACYLAVGRSAALTQLKEAERGRAAAERLLYSALDEAASWRDKRDAADKAAVNARAAAAACQKSASALQSTKHKLKEELKALQARIALEEQSEGALGAEGAEEAAKTPAVLPEQEPAPVVGGEKGAVAEARPAEEAKVEETRQQDWSGLRTGNGD
jgi:hypothetical protein